MRARHLIGCFALLFAGCILPTERVLQTDSGAGGAGGVSATGGSGGTPIDAGGAGGQGGGAQDGGGQDVGGQDVGGADGPIDQSILTGCVLLLHMNELDWAGVPPQVIDSSGLGNNGTANGDATTVAGGKFGRAGSFDGNASVTVPNSDSLQPTTALTFAAWVYPTGLDGVKAPGIVVKRTAYAQNTAFTMFFWTNNDLFVDIDGENDRFQTTFAFDNNTWYHLAVVYDGGLPKDQRVRLYVNGAFVMEAAESSSSIAPSPADVSIGLLPGGGDNFIGLIDEVAIWTRALGDPEVAALPGMQL